MSWLPSLELWLSRFGALMGFATVAAARYGLADDELKEIQERLGKLGQKPLTPFGRPSKDKAIWLDHFFWKDAF